MASKGGLSPMRQLLAALTAIPLALVLTSGCTATQVQLDTIELPPGFVIDIYADHVPGGRSLALSPQGTLFVGSRDQGKVYAVHDRDGDKRADTVITLAQGLNMPNGVAFQDGDLYVAEVSRVIRYPGVEHNLTTPGPPQIVNDTFPAERHHGWKFIRFGPDGLLYVPVGAPCNICNPGDPYAAILRLRPDGSGLQVFARGIRNTVGFDWHPLTQELWFTDNGRDGLGDDLPPDELNRAPSESLHFGYPYRHGKDTADPQYGQEIGMTQVVPPVLELAPHAAALGMRFYTGDMFPTRYRNQIFIAEHGSWNRSTPLGYRIMLATLEGNTATSYTVFAKGWLQGSKAWGRPVDLLVMPDGSLLVSDDRAGVIYRVWYRTKQQVIS